MQLAADEKEACSWERTATILALLANAHRDPKKRRRPYQPWDFFHRPGQPRPRSGQALTTDVLHHLGPAIAKGNE